MLLVNLLNNPGVEEQQVTKRESLHLYQSSSRVEKAFFKQKSGVSWFRLGDQNSTYFLLSGKSQI